MADPKVLRTEGFLLPRDEDAVSALREDVVDERTWLDVVHVPRRLQSTIRGPILRQILMDAGMPVWPKGELDGERLAVFLAGLKSLRVGGEFLHADPDMANRIISLLEQAVADDLSIWVNF